MQHIFYIRKSRNQDAAKKCFTVVYNVVETTSTRWDRIPCVVVEKNLMRQHKDGSIIAKKIHLIKILAIYLLQ